MSTSYVPQSPPNIYLDFATFLTQTCQFQWTSGLRRGSVAACLLGLRVRNPPGAWISVSSDCSVFLGNDLCDRPILCSNETYRLRCVILYDLETSRMRRLWPALDCCAKGKNSSNRSTVRITNNEPSFYAVFSILLILTSCSNTEGTAASNLMSTYRSEKSAPKLLHAWNSVQTEKLTVN